MVATTPVPSIQPLLKGRRPTVALAALWVFIVGPFLALLAAGAGRVGLGLSWLDVTIAVTGYLITGLGISVGFHRYLTHRSFKATLRCGSP